jgi:hypothetical protein
LAIIAYAILAILLASAMAATLVGRRVSILFIPCSLRHAPRRTTSAGAGADSILAEMMELGR